MTETPPVRSCTLSGRATSDLREGRFSFADLGGQEYEVEVSDSTAVELLRNLGEPYQDASEQFGAMLEPGRQLFVFAMLYSGPAGRSADAKRIVMLGRSAADYRFEDPTWWTVQIDRLAAFYRRAQFGAGEIDYDDYRTMLRLGGDKTDDHIQETDTISRLVYGMASAYMLTGEDDYLDVAERGVEYLRDHMRFVDADEGVVYWYHGIRRTGGREKKLLTSEFGDDYDAIPMYEQIYALVGPVQTLRVSGDPLILDDVEKTLRLFDLFFRDHDLGGYFSHIDPITLDPRSTALGPNRSRKNWNSVGDHAPAYLVNLFLATGDERHADMLERTFDAIVEHFAGCTDSPFVQERFHEDWRPDRAHGWQQDRAVIGHNLKIAWNLMRMQSLRPKPAYVALAERIGRTMPAVGSDRTRGGWYDMVERVRRPGESWHRFCWHDRKAWWQQEQAILAYLLLAGVTGDEEFLAEARNAAAFYNAFFLDQDEGGVYFNVVADGFPYLLGTERLKGSHSMSMYHAAELCYLSAVYTNLLVNRQPLDLWFKPLPNGFADRVLRVQPDILPVGSVRLSAVEVDGSPYLKFDPEALTVDLPPTDARLTVRVTLEPVER